MPHMGDEMGKRMRSMGGVGRAAIGKKPPMPMPADSLMNMMPSTPPKPSPASWKAGKVKGAQPYRSGGGFKSKPDPNKSKPDPNRRVM